MMPDLNPQNDLALHAFFIFGISFHQVIFQNLFSFCLTLTEILELLDRFAL